MWLLLYDDDGSVKLGGYDRRFRVIEVLNRDGGAHVFVDVDELGGGTPRDVSPRAGDLVTVKRGVIEALQRAVLAAKLFLSCLADYRLGVGLALADDRPS